MARKVPPEKQTSTPQSTDSRQLSEEMPATSAESRVMRRKEVEKKTGIKRAHIYRLMRAGRFPKCLRIGVRAVGWDSVEVEQWISDRRKERPAT